MDQNNELDKTYEMPDGQIITIGSSRHAKRFNQLEVKFVQTRVFRIWASFLKLYLIPKYLCVRGYMA